jgi:nicotinamide-nucleotide adenylyltransferase
MRILVVGRFQPLHLGHVRMLEYAADKATYLIIGLGSCNSSYTSDNPFTAQEREEMIKESVDLKKPYEIKRIPDFGDNGRWVAWVRENLSFDAYMTNSPNERAIFQEAGFKVLDMPFFDRGLYSATEVRGRILEDRDWASLLPQGTIKVLSTIDGVFRIKKLSQDKPAE